MARPRAARYDDQRMQILRCAAEVFARSGYTAATLSEVARSSGVSKATLYHYFLDKQQLLFEITHGQVQQLASLVAGVQDRGLKPAEHLRTLIASFMQAYAGSEHAHRVLTEDLKFLEADARRTVEDVQREVVQAFADAVAAVRPDLRPVLHKPLAMLLFGMINWTFTWLKPDGELTHDSLAPLVVDLFLGGLQELSGPSSTSHQGLHSG